MSKFSIFAFLLFSLLDGYSQQFGGNPSGRKWKQLNADSFVVIFPAETERMAHEIAAVIAEMDNDLDSRGIRSFRKLPIVLQNRMNTSNGYVGVGPWRSEYYISPLQNSFRLGSVPWHAQLAIHEYRHAQQYRHFMKGLTKAVYTVLGQDAGSLFSNMAVPNWFWEGDAVFKETSLTQQGRGRLPHFFNNSRAIWQAGKDYSWLKWRNGSLKDRMPDHYELGYMFVAYGNEKYGSNFWSDVTADASAFKGVLYPFQQAIKRRAGVNYRQFRADALNYFRKQTDSLSDSVTSTASRSKRFDADQDFPQWLDDSTITYLESSYDKIPRFVIKHKNGSTKVLADRYISIDRQFSYSNKKIVYTTYRPDRRWSYWDYTDIVLLDVPTSAQKIITHKARYFSPALNEDASRIIAVRLNDSGTTTLNVLSADGKLLMEIKPAANYFYTYPKFLNDDAVVAAARNDRGEMGIVKIDLSTGDHNTLLPFSKRVIGFIDVYQNKISFTASMEDADQTFVIDGSQLFVVQSNWNIPVYHPSLRNETWLMQAVSASGNVIIRSNVTKPVSIQEFIGASSDGPYKLTTWKRDIVETALQNAAIKDTGTKGQIEGAHQIVSNYRQSHHLVNFHSVRPYGTGSDIGIAVNSDNVLGNLSLQLGASYNLNEEYKSVGASVVYGGWFPWIRLGVDYSWDRNALYGNSRLFWNQTEPRIGLTLPLNFTSGKWYRHFQPSVDYVHTQRTIIGYFKDSLKGRSFGYIQPVLRFSAEAQRARKNIFPKYAVDATVNYKKTINGNADHQQILCAMDFYLPGAAKNHALVFNVAGQLRDTGLALFTNNFFFSRGYEAENFRRMFRAGVNYHFPIIYPDRGVGGIVYVQRVRANLFYDYTQVYNDRKTSRMFRSTGVELHFDTKWWNQQPLSFGIRYSRLLDRDLYSNQEGRWELVVPTIF